MKKTIATILSTIALVVGMLVFNPATASAEDTDGVDIRHSIYSDRTYLIVFRHGWSTTCQESLDHGSYLARGKSTGEYWVNPEASTFYVPAGYKAKVTNNSGVTTWVNEPGCRTLRYDSSPKIVELVASVA